MCGIIALFSSQGTVNSLALQAGLQALQHRGPDGQRFWVDPQRRVGLGHARLSIIDLVGGEQPIANQSETLRIIVNGEFYGYEAIQTDLRQLGYVLTTQSDSEIALHLYDELGTQCLHHLRGEFAFILWDKRNDCLIAARDRFGIKPLYYTVHQGTLYLASEVKALFAAGVPASWDEESFFLANTGVLLPDRSLFANIHQVPPGHYLIASRSGVRLFPYWDFDYPSAEASQSTMSIQDYGEQLRDQFDEAVRLRLRADVPVGCYLSGGLDSAAVLGMASRYSAQPIQAFTLAFDHEAYNEETIAREMAAQVGANLHVIPVRAEDLAENFADAIYHGEMLCINTGTVAKYLLSRMTRDWGYKVVLTGEGADEIFGGYAGFRQDMLLHNTEGQDPAIVQLLLEELRSSNAISVGVLLLSEGSNYERLKGVNRLLGFTPSWMEASVAGHLRSSWLYASEFLHKFDPRDSYRLLFNQIDIQRQIIGRDAVHQSMYLWSKTIFPNYLLRLLGDGVEMAHSIEGRLPFLDHKLVEFVRHIPVSLKISGMTEKYILREAVRPFITETIYNRSKHPFMAPPSSFQMNSSLSQFLQDTLRSQSMAAIPFYNQAAVIQFLDQLPQLSVSQQTAAEVSLIKMLSACVLQERFGLT